MIYRIEIENGYYLYKLEEVLKTKKISKTKLSLKTETDFNTIQRLSRGAFSRIDITVLARICDYLDCKSNNIIEYIPNKR